MEEPDLGPEPGWSVPPERIGHPHRSFVSGDPDGQRIRIRYYRDLQTGQRVAKVWFGPMCEGPIHHAHGGSLAAVLDEAMGSACWIMGQRVLAGTLTVRYRAPVPLGLTAIVRTEVVSVEGRKVLTVGRILGLDGTLYTEAEGTFIRMRPEHEEAFLREAGERGDYAMPDAY